MMKNQSDYLECLFQLTQPDGAKPPLANLPRGDRKIADAQYTTTSIIVLSGQHEAMLGALELMFGGRLNIHAEIFARDDASAAQPNEKRPLINRSQPSTSDLGLTERQLDVLALMMQGKSNKAICRVLNLAEATVKNHVTIILRALKVSNRTEAVIAVGELGWKICHRRATRFCNRESPLEL